MKLTFPIQLRVLFIAFGTKTNLYIVEEIVMISLKNVEQGEHEQRNERKMVNM